jgi:protoporphyrinogen oxidase
VRRETDALVCYAAAVASESRIGVLGGGVSGLSLVANLKKRAEVLEKDAICGGLCSSVVEDGFTFDAAGPHILFSKNKEVLDYMVGVLGDNVDKKRRENKIWFKGHLVKYPFENGLSDLPKEDCYECIRDYLKNPWTKEPENLAEWSYATFGASISDKYFIPYNRKIWNYDPAKISLQWVSRIPKPPMEDVLKSAVGISTEGYLHQLYFYYPKVGGYQSLVKNFATLAGDKVRNNETITRVAKTSDGWDVETKSGVRKYKTLVSTLPIHDLLKIWDGAPKEAHEVSKKLRYNSLINVLIGAKEKTVLPYTAVYLPATDIVFHRLSFPKQFSEQNVPPGHLAFMAEITANDGDGVWELSDDAVFEKVVEGLEKIEFLKREDITYRKVVRFTYGYPVYDVDYFDNSKKLRALVEAEGIRLLGRFAQFEYINSDVCVERALALAKNLDGDAAV